MSKYLYILNINTGYKILSVSPYRKYLLFKTFEYIKSNIVYRV